MKKYIYAMSKARGPAKEHIESYRKVITDHLIECIVYGDSLQCYAHWVGELAAWFDDINKTELKIKRNPPKFKYKEYKEYVFGLFGNTTSDARGALLSYQANNKYYPHFDITRDLVLRLSGAVLDLSDMFCTEWSTSRGSDFSTNEIETMIHSVLDEYLD